MGLGVMEMGNLIYFGAENPLEKESDVRFLK
jgi:hypothetical protein